MRDPKTFYKDIAAVSEAARLIPHDTHVGLVKWVANPQNPTNELSAELERYRKAMTVATSRSMKLCVARGLGMFSHLYGHGRTLGDVRTIVGSHTESLLSPLSHAVLQQLFGALDEAATDEPSTEIEEETPATEWISYT